MKYKSKQIILICITVCILLFNISLLLSIQLNKIELNKAKHKLEHFENIEFMFEESKRITVNRFKYEQYQIGNSLIYKGSNATNIMPILSITDQPKLVLGLNQNMCRPCVEAVFNDVTEFFPDFKTNPNILCIADIEERFKDDYYGKKVISFHQKRNFPLYEIETRPYFFILDKDLCVKMMFITDIASPELTKEYLKTIKKRYLNI